jgi:hypothetical protein
VRIVDIRERCVSISRYADPSLPTGGLTTSIVAVITDVVRDGKPVVGYGFSSIGRYAQSGLIRERFAPRLLNSTDLAFKDGTKPEPAAAESARASVIASAFHEALRAMPLAEPLRRERRQWLLVTTKFHPGTLPASGFSPFQGYVIWGTNHGTIRVLRID